MTGVRHTWLLVSLVSLAGCNNDGLIAVSGKVTWNGDPIERGNISFYPTDPSLRPDAGAIVDGKFQFRASPGEKRVEIFADRPVGKPDKVMNLQRYEQFIPTRYNEQTELRATVSKGSKAFQFDLVAQDDDVKAGSRASARPQ